MPLYSVKKNTSFEVRMLLQMICAPSRNCRQKPLSEAFAARFRPYGQSIRKAYLAHAEL